MNNESMRLANQIAVAATNYYLGSPIMSDEEFDRLVEKLENIDSNHKILNSVGWGVDLDASPLEKVAHPYCKLLGLPKSKISETDVLKTKGYDKIHTPKLDGLSVEVLYKNGLLDKAITRGNGEVGLDITSKIRHLVPLALFEEVDLSVRGEFVLSFDNYYKYYSDSPSPRNIASGVLNRKEVDVEEIRRFNLVAYKIIASSSEKAEMLTNRRFMLNLLDMYGFEVVPHVATNRNLKYSEVYNSLSSRLKQNYPLDGIVTSSTIERLSKVGNVHVVDYEGEIAYKTITETATSKVTDISWNLTRTGKLIPTVIYEPVELSGATLTRALGHNAKYISDNLIDAGAVIEVVRSGEVIPYILGVEEPSNEVNIPKVCPSCGGSTKWKGVDIVCTNPNCSSKEDANIRHWIYNTSPVHGVGGSLITSIIDALNITCVEDLYKVTDSDITKLYSTNGIGHNKIELVRSLFFELNKHKDLATFLVGLNLDGLGWSSANKLVSNELYDLIRKKQRIQITDYLLNYKHKGVMRKTKEAIIENLDKIFSLLDYVSICYFSDAKPHKEDESSNDLIPLCVTGKLESFANRKELFEILKGLVVEADIKKCKYLLCNEDKGSSKIKYAKANNIPVINESELRDILGILEVSSSNE